MSRPAHAPENFCCFTLLMLQSPPARYNMGERLQIHSRKERLKMRKLMLVFATLMVMLAVTVVPAGAITGNFVEDFQHPFVGLVVFYDANGEFSHRCSGSLL